MLKSLSIFCLAIMLSACSNQQYDGLAVFDFEACEAGDRYQICKVKVIDGKEKDSVKITAKLPDGVEFTYEASNIKAFEGQAIRAEVEKAIADRIGEIVKAILGRSPGG